jgi:predicted peptidase
MDSEGFGKNGHPDPDWRVPLLEFLLMKRFCVGFLLVTVCLQVWGGSATSQEATFEGLSYRLHRPTDAGSHPLLVYLHGAGGGWNRSLVKSAFQRAHPCFVLLPRTRGLWTSPKSKSPDWSEETIESYSPPLQKLIRKAIARVEGEKPKELLRVIGLIESLVQQYPIDRNRIYVMGHSMGGMGSWGAIWERPDLFAAAVPSSGVLTLWKDLERVKSVPIWAFHGSKDRAVPVEGTRTLFARLQKLQGKMKYTELTGEGHNSGRIAFGYSGDEPSRGWVTRSSSPDCDPSDNLWEWVFAQRLDRR